MKNVSNIFLKQTRKPQLACPETVPVLPCPYGGLHGFTRRGFMASTLGAALSGIATQSHAAVPYPVEKKALKIGFVPISCAAPLIMAQAKGYFQDEGITVELRKTPGWALIRDNLLNGSFDASHLLSPMPLALSAGAGHTTHPVRAVTMQNINGQAITLALKHRERRDPRDWKGMTFAIPFEFSMHNLMLRAYLAHYGLDPDHDVTLRVTAPPEMVANLRAGNIDGFLGPEPFNQRAVIDEIGFLHILTAEIWDGHPCCALGMTEEFIAENPNTYAAVQRAMIRAAAFMHKMENRLEAAQILSKPEYLNHSELVIRQGLTGHYADGLGNVKNNLHRAEFSPFPYYSSGVWMMEQMQRWGYIPRSVDSKNIVEQVFLLPDVRRQATALALADLPSPENTNYPGFQVLGVPFTASTSPSTQGAKP